MTDMQLQDQIVALTVLQKRVSDELKRRKAAWSESARPKQRDAAAIGDVELGTVTMTKGRLTVKVTDMGALVAWAQRERPEVLSYDPHVADADLARLKREVEATGELLPGFDIVEGSPYPSVRLEKDAARVIEDAVRSGEITWGSVLEVES